MLATVHITVGKSLVTHSRLCRVSSIDFGYTNHACLILKFELTQHTRENLPSVTRPFPALLCMGPGMRLEDELMCVHVGVNVTLVNMNSRNGDILDNLLSSVISKDCPDGCGDAFLLLVTRDHKIVHIVVLVIGVTILLANSPLDIV